MFVNKDSIQINGVSMGQYLLKVEYGLNKLWRKRHRKKPSGRHEWNITWNIPKNNVAF